MTTNRTTKNTRPRSVAYLGSDAVYYEARLAGASGERVSVIEWRQDCPKNSAKAGQATVRHMTGNAMKGTYRLLESAVIDQAEVAAWVEARLGA